MITEEAVNCTDGTTLGSARQDVARSDDLPRAMDRIGAMLRHDLGESRRMISRFNKPLSSQETGSLKALEDFSQAVYLGRSGKFAEGIDLLKDAVALDPQFAAAYFNLSAYSSNISDPEQAQAYLRKAYEVRDFATEPTRLTITAAYQSDITGDLYESLRTYRSWISTYPHYAPAWNGLSKVLAQLGRNGESADAAGHQLELIPDSVGAYQALAYSQILNEDFAGARKTCDLALSRGFDGALIRERLYTLGRLTHDPGLVTAEEQWFKDHPSPSFLAEEADFALIEGRIADSLALLDRMDAAFRDQGTPTAGQRLRQRAARSYFEMGDTAVARAQVHVAPVGPDDLNSLFALAETGQPDAAAAILRDQVARSPQDTLITRFYAPELHALIALLAHKPAEAVATLEPLAVGDIMELNVFYLLGQAHMQTGQLTQAEANFRTFLAHPGLAPESSQMPLSRLYLARVLSMEQKKTEATEVYRTLLSEWSNADATLLLHKQAASEWLLSRPGIEPNSHDLLLAPAAAGTHPARRIEDHPSGHCVPRLSDAAPRVQAFPLKAAKL